VIKLPTFLAALWSWVLPPEKVLAPAALKERPPVSPVEVWVFAHHDHARTCGFREGVHVQDRNMRCYSIRSADPDRLRGLWLGKVIITEHARVYLNHDATAREQEAWGYAESLLRHYLGRAQPGIWIEL
jgi:hypothetical protein